MTRHLERWYAFAVFLLRNFFKLNSLDNLSDWKATTTIVFAETLLAFAVFIRLSVVADWRDFLNSRVPLLASAFVIFNVVYWLHKRAEKRLLHKYEGEFHQLGRPQRVAATIGVLALVVLSIWVDVRIAVYARDYLAGVG